MESSINDVKFLVKHEGIGFTIETTIYVSTGQMRLPIVRYMAATKDVVRADRSALDIIELALNPLFESALEDLGYNNSSYYDNNHLPRD
jgi:hypothetical protein